MKVQLRYYKTNKGTRLRVWKTRNGNKVVITRHFHVVDKRTNKQDTLYISVAIELFGLFHYRHDGTSFYGDGFHCGWGIASKTNETVDVAEWGECPNRQYDPPMDTK